MGDEKKSDTEKEQKSGLPQINAVHFVIAIAVIVLAVIFIGKFGFGTDLLSPSSGEMAIVKRPVVTAVPTVVQNPAIRETLSGIDTKEPLPGAAGAVVTITSALTTTAASSCPSGQTLCEGVSFSSCSNLQTDTYNCGACGNSCYGTNPPLTKPYCYQGKCTWECLENYRFCGNLAEGCVAMTFADKHCGNCNTDCGSGKWCNSTHCESGLRPVTYCDGLRRCEYPNRCGTVVDPVTHKPSAWEFCIPPS